MAQTGTDQTASLQRLKRIAGQVQGIQRMVEQQRYCIDILQQITAVRRALDQVGLQLMERHINGCVAHAVRGAEGEAKIRELVSTVERFLK